MLKLLRSLSSALLGREGVAPLLVGFLLNGLALVLSNFLKRKRLSWRERYNSKIGLVPELVERNPKIESFLATLENISVLIIRISNTGRSTVTKEDYHEPLRFAFKNRFILDFRVSNPRPVDIRDTVEKGAYVSRTIGDFGNPPDNKTYQQTLREALSGPLSSPSNEDPFTNEEKDARRQLTIPAIELKPRDEFTIVIDLRESIVSPGLESTDKEYTCSGKLRSGKLVDQNARNKRVTLTQILAAPCLVLFGGLIVTIARPVYSTKELYCAEGKRQWRGRAHSDLSPTRYRMRTCRPVLAQLSQLRRMEVLRVSARY